MCASLNSSILNRLLWLVNWVPYLPNEPLIGGQLIPSKQTFLIGCLSHFPVNIPPPHNLWACGVSFSKASLTVYKLTSFRIWHIQSWAGETFPDHLRIPSVFRQLDVILDGRRGVGGARLKRLQWLFFGVFNRTRRSPGQHPSVMDHFQIAADGCKLLRFIAFPASNLSRGRGLDFYLSCLVVTQFNKRVYYNRNSLGKLEEKDRES